MATLVVGLRSQTEMGALVRYKEPTGSCVAWVTLGWHSVKGGVRGMLYSWSHSLRIGCLRDSWAYPIKPNGRQGSGPWKTYALV